MKRSKMVEILKREGKKDRLREKLGEDKYHWAWEVQSKPFPSWLEAFEYAYKLGLKRGKQYGVKTIYESECVAIEDALEENNWDITEAAKDLKIKRSILYQKMNQYNIKKRS